MIQHNNMNSGNRRTTRAAADLHLDEIVSWRYIDTYCVIALKFGLTNGATWTATYRTLNGEQLEVPVSAPAKSMYKPVHQKMVLIARLVAKLLFGKKAVSDFELLETIQQVPNYNDTANTTS